MHLCIMMCVRQDFFAQAGFVFILCAGLVDNATVSLQKV